MENIQIKLTEGSIIITSPKIDDYYRVCEEDGSFIITHVIDGSVVKGSMTYEDITHAINHVVAIINIRVKEQEAKDEEYCYYTKEDEAEESKYARKCDVTNKGMNEGYCIDGGGMYIQSEVDMLKHLEEHTAYESMEEAVEDEYCYWTEWTELDEDGYYLADGTFVDTEEDEVEEDEDEEEEMSEADKREQREIDAFEDDRQSNW